MTDIQKTIHERKQAYYRALVQLQEDFAAEFDALAVEENKTIGSEAQHMAKTLRYEATQIRRNHLQE
jgi:hypothetical protein